MTERIEITRVFYNNLTYNSKNYSVCTTAHMRCKSDEKQEVGWCIVPNHGQCSKAHVHVKRFASDNYVLFSASYILIGYIFSCDGYFFDAIKTDYQRILLVTTGFLVHYKLLLLGGVVYWQCSIRRVGVPNRQAKSDLQIETTGKVGFNLSFQFLSW